jgi:hypothetical protein
MNQKFRKRIVVKMDKTQVHSPWFLPETWMGHKREIQLEIPENFEVQSARRALKEYLDLFGNTGGVTSLRNGHKERNHNIRGVGPLDLGESKISRQIKKILSHDRQISLRGDRRWGTIVEIAREIKARVS